MSRIIRSLINSAIKDKKPNIILFNMRNPNDCEGFDLNIYTFDNFDHPNLTKITKQDLDFNLDLEFDCLVNLRPYDDNLTEIMKFSGSSRLPLYNYIVDIGIKKKEILMRKSQLLEKFSLNFFSSQELADQVFLPNKIVGTKDEFSRILNNEKS